MSAPDPDSFGFWATVVTAVATPILWAEKRLNAKADKEDIRQLYRNAEEDRRLTRDLHDKAMEAIRENQVQIIETLRK